MLVENRIVDVNLTSGIANLQANEWYMWLKRWENMVLSRIKLAEAITQS